MWDPAGEVQGFTTIMEELGGHGAKRLIDSSEMNMRINNLSTLPV